MQRAQPRFCRISLMAASAMLWSSSWLLPHSSRVRTATSRGAALIADELRLVQTSLLGSVLSNILLVLGMSFFACVISRFCKASLMADPASTFTKPLSKLPRLRPARPSSP